MYRIRAVIVGRQPREPENNDQRGWAPRSTHVNIDRDKMTERLLKMFATAPGQQTYHATPAEGMHAMPARPPGRLAAGSPEPTNTDDICWLSQHLFTIAAADHACRPIPVVSTMTFSTTSSNMPAHRASPSASAQPTAPICWYIMVRHSVYMVVRLFRRSTDRQITNSGSTASTSRQGRQVMSAR